MIHENEVRKIIYFMSQVYGQRDEALKLCKKARDLKG